MREWLTRTRWLLYLLLALLAIGYTAAHSTERPAFSPYDEYVYYDYLSKVPSDGFVQTGEEVGTDARNELSCRGVQGFGSYGEGCDSPTHDDDALYPYGGGTGADIYAPPYFVATWALAQPFSLLGSDLVDAGRWVGAVWLAAGLCLTFALFRSLRVSTAVSFGVTALLVALPAVYWATQYISTDAPALAISAAIGLAAVSTARRRVGPWLLPLLAVVAVLLKVQNLGAVAVASAALILFAVRSAAPGERLRVLGQRLVLTAIASVVAGIAAQAAWMLIRRSSAVGDPPMVDITQTALSASNLASEAVKFLGRLGESDVAVGAWSTLWGGIFSLACIGALIAVGLEFRRRVRSSTALATLAVGLAFGPALAAASLVLVGQYVPLPARYGLVFVVPAALALAWFLDRSPSWRTVTLSAGAAIGVASIVLV